MEAGNFDNNSSLDLAVAHTHGGFSTLLNRGNGRFTPPTMTPTGGTTATVSIDVDNIDGSPGDDIVVGKGLGQQASAYVNDGSGGFTLLQTFDLPDDCFEARFGDLNLDGASDLIVLVYGGASPLLTWRNDGFGRFCGMESMPTIGTAGACLRR